MTWEPLISTSTIFSYLMVAFRIGGVFFLAPLLGNRAVPNRVKLGLTLTFSFLIFPFVPSFDVSTVKTLPSMIVAVMSEVSIGAILGYLSSLIVAAVQTAGEFMGMQVGFGMASIFDPAMEGSSSVIASFFVIIGSLIFLYMNGHHVILAATIRSFEWLPLGSSFNLSIGYSLADTFAKAFVIALKMSAPILVVTTCLSMVFGLITKLSPQMNIYFNVGFILSPLAGMLMLIVSLPLFKVLMISMVEDLSPQLAETVLKMREVP